MNDKKDKLQNLLDQYEEDLNPVKSKEEIAEEEASKESKGE